jgi:hypothetical protein
MATSSKQGITPNRMVLAHVVWMEQYTGDTETLWQAGWDFEGGNHEGERSGERFLFNQHDDGRYYGYIAKWTPITLENIDPDVDGDTLDGVTVVWTATPPHGGDRVIVGWYANATVYRDPIRRRQSDGQEDQFFFSAKPDDVTWVSPSRRTFKIKVGRPKQGILGPGQSKIYYVSNRAPTLAREISTYITKFKNKPDSVPEKGRRLPRQPDTEIRLAVERESMKLVTESLERAGWNWDDVSAQKVGWDVTATTKDKTACVEVKGLSGSYMLVELTPNEFKFFQKPPKNSDYILAVVTHSLDASTRQVNFFRRTGKLWHTFDIVSGRKLQPGLTLEVETLVGARVWAQEP